MHSKCNCSLMISSSCSSVVQLRDFLVDRGRVVDTLQ